MKRFFDWLIAWGPLGIFAIAAVDSAGIPLAGGADAAVLLLAIKAPESAYIGALAAVLGSIAGNVFLFYLSRRGGRRFLERNTEPGSRAMRFRAWFARYGLVTVFIPAIVPIPLPLKIFVISAGALGSSFARFLAVIILARVVRYAGLAYLGRRLGLESTRFLKDHAWDLIGVAALLLVFCYLLIRWNDRRRIPVPGEANS